MITTAVLISLVIGLLTGLLGYIAKQILFWFVSVYKAIFYNAMAVETTFADILSNGNLQFNITALYHAIYTFAIALLMMFFVKKMIETYMAWSNRRPRNFSNVNTFRICKSSYNYDKLWIYL